MVIQCEIWAKNPQYEFNDNIVPQVSAARQGFKQLNIRLTMAVSAVSVWVPAACNPSAKMVAALEASSSFSFPARPPG